MVGTTQAKINPKSIRYSPKIKLRALEFLRRGESIPVISNRLKVPHGSLYAWKAKMKKEEAKGHHANGNGNSVAGAIAAARDNEESYAVVYLFARCQREIEIYANNSVALVPHDLAYRVGELLQRTAMRSRVRTPNRMPLLRGDSSANP